MDSTLQPIAIDLGTGGKGDDRDGNEEGGERRIKERGEKRTEGEGNGATGQNLSPVFFIPSWHVCL